MKEERFCEYLENLIHVPIIRMNADCQSKVKDDEKIRCNLTIEQVKETVNDVGIIKANKYSMYAAVKKADTEYFLIGPVWTCVEENRTEKKEKVYECKFMTLIEAALMLYEYCTGKEKNIFQFIQNEVDDEYKKILEQKKAKYHFFQQENGWIHNSYKQECREQNAIKEGSLERLKDAVSEPRIGKLGESSKNRIRSIKNTCIIVIALSVRSAIEGGLDSEEAFQMCDNYMAQIENLNNIKKLAELTRNAQIELTKLVKEKKELAGSDDPYVNQCKKYVYQHLHEKIIISDIAGEIGLTESYLSDVFRRKEGMTLSAYITKIKINYAQNLLIYSDYNYDEIAYYFGFSSRSHFGSAFKKVTGQTPKQFRDRNHEGGCWTIAQSWTAVLISLSMHT